MNQRSGDKNTVCAVGSELLIDILIILLKDFK